MAPAVAGDPSDGLPNCQADESCADRRQDGDRRVVSLGQAQTEILYVLGLGDRVVGTAVWFSPFAKPYEAVNAKVKRLADNDPSVEAVVGQEPDLVVAMYERHIGPNGIVGKRDRCDSVKVLVYVPPTDRIGKDNTGAVSMA